MADSARQQRILKQHFQTDRLLGIDMVPVSLPTARQSGIGTSDFATPAGKQSQSNRPAPRPAVTSRSSTAAAPSTAVTQSPPPSAQAPLIRPTYEPIPKDLPAEQRLVMLNTINENEVQGCTRCKLCESRTNTVFGEGHHQAEVMFVGEGPGQDEDRQGRPFVGRSGELLDKQITAMGFKREDVYIANVVKCSPPNNRAPTPDEADACWSYLARQIELVNPKVLVTLGGPAAKRLLNTTTGVTRLRGNWFEYTAIDPAIPVMPTFHPAYLLRAYTKENRMKVWSDLKAVLEKIGRTSPG